MVLLTVLTIALILVLVGALVYYLVRIIAELEAIGGDADSLLAKVRWGVRAIERMTDPIGPQVTTLNEGLGAVGAGLGEIQGNLEGIAAALGRQGSSS